MGVALFVAEGGNPNLGARLGVLSAVAAAHAGEKFREEGARLGAPNLVLGLLEDGIVLFGGRRLLRGES